MRVPLSQPEFRTWTMSDGYLIHGRIWNPHPPLGVAGSDLRTAYLYFHGIQSHGGWFEWSASLLAHDGSPVIVPDRRGSGLNRESRGDTPSLDRWLQDVDEIASWVEHEFGIPRLRFVGVSWGGKLAAMHALRHSDRVEKLLLITPGIFPAVDVSFRERMRIAASLLSNPQAEHEIPLNDPALFTDNPEAQAFITADPLKLTHATARLLWHSSRFDRLLRRAADGSLKVPTTLLLAGHDRIIRNEPTEAWCRRVCAAGLEVIRFDSDVHTLEFSRQTRRFQDRLETWAAERKRC